MTLVRPLLALALMRGVLACSSLPNATSDASTDGPPGTAPSLTSLEVTSGASPTLTLVPPFAPDVYDYYVRCNAGANALTVSMMASTGALSSLLSASPPTPSQQQTVALSVNENQAIVATAAAGGVTTEYWIRCLPHDFAEMSMIAHPEAGTPPPGYYVLGNNLLHPGAAWGYAMILDGRGVPVWYAHGTAVGSRDWDVDSLLPGTVSFFPLFGGPVDVHQLSPPKTTYPAPPTSVDFDSHELQVLPNGNYVAISAPTQSGIDLTGVRIGFSDGGGVSFGPDSSVVQCNIVEFEPKTGKVMWTWLSSEHLDAAKETTVPQLAHPLPDGGATVETFHCNSIDVDRANGNLLVSARNMDSIFYIDRKTGKILWKMGGHADSKEHAAYVKVDDPFYRQHDARLQPGWSSSCSGGRGQISLFDDESNRHPPARGVLYDVVVGAGDGGSSADCGTTDSGAVGATRAWQYQGRNNSSGQGSFRISPDGSHVIGWGVTGTTGLVFTEVDSRGNDLLDFYFTDGNVSYRAIKVPLTAFDLGVLRSTAGQPL